MKRIIRMAAVFVFTGLLGASAAQATQCATITNYAELMEAGTCTAGPDDAVSFTNFATNLDQSLWSSIGVFAGVGGSMGFSKPEDNPGLFGFVFNVPEISSRTISFALSALCDLSICEFNDGQNRVQGNSGHGEWNLNGTIHSITDGNQLFSPIFYPWVAQLDESVTYTFEEGKIVGGLYEFGVNTVPSSWDDNLTKRLGSPNDVPEPASLALLSLGLFGVGMTRRRANRK